MTTEAQIQANRANAQQSTGPRTPEGKEKAAQNALKHGLLAKDAVVVGEEFDEFDLFRAQFRADLAPVGMAESLLVERIVGLSWRLQRAERFHTEAFDMLYLHCAADPQVKRRWPTSPPGQTDPIFGETVVKDFSETKVLERLLMYERRIENSLYRTMAELRQVQGQRRGAGGIPLSDNRSRRSLAGDDRRGPFHRVRETLPPDFTLDNLLAKIAALEEGPGSPAAEFRGWEPHQTQKDAFGHPEPPVGATTNLPEAQSQSCETKPIEEVSSLKCEVSSEESRTASPQSPPTSNFTLQTPAGTPTVPSPSCETNPISEGVSSSKCQMLGKTCETNPICGGGSSRQGGYRPIFRRRR